MASQHSLFMTQHSAYVWHPLHCRAPRTHSVTPNHGIYDITSTSGRTTQPLYQTSHPLYLCHHTVSTDISRTFIRHHTHVLCDIVWTIYNITPNPYVITLLYLWHRSLYIWNHIQYEGTISLNMWYHRYYLCHHTHCIDNFTHTLCMRSHSA